MARGTEVPVFPVMVLIGLTVFGLAFVASQNMDLTDSGKTPDRMIYESQSFGQVGSSNQDFRIVRFGSFNVGELRGNVQAYTARKARISNGFLSSRVIQVEYNASQPRGGDVTFEVLGRGGNGQVYVRANGKKVWQNHLIATGTPEIDIPANALKPGMNTITIGTTQGGFFSSTEYALEEVEVTVNDRKFHDFQDSFQVFDYELQDFVSSQLTFSITSSVKTSPLQVFVNDRRVYSKRQVRISPEKVEIDPRKADLHPGYNSIRFETDGEAKYTIKNSQLTIRYIGNTRRRTLRLAFGVNSSGLKFAKRDDTREKITFEYQRLLPSPHPMVITLNGNSHRINPKNGKNTIAIEASELQESNTLLVKSNATYQMNNLRVMSERVGTE